MSVSNQGQTEGLYHQLKNDFNDFVTKQKAVYKESELLRMDLHCHDDNSDVPDEILGRILNVPETWLKSDRLIDELVKNGMNVLTITNHNNARSCYIMQDKGVDVLTAAEFTCTVTDFNVGIHVLTYGFSYEQEKVLNKLRRNLYSFLEYTKENNIPVIWAHPLYYYASQVPPIEFFEKMSLVFERFEVINGQRNNWQNMLTREWILTMTPDYINRMAEKHQLDVHRYCRDPYCKVMSGGSDSHIGLFAGETGTLLHVPGLQKKLKTKPASELALEAILEGRMVPFGQPSNSEKLTISLLDYVSQIALNMRDPGLLRILLHKGTTNDKILAILISNAFLELKHHKVTLQFIELFHRSLLGKKPPKIKRLFVSKNYRSVFDDAVKMAEISRDKDRSGSIEKYQETIASMHSGLVQLLYHRLEKKLSDMFEKFREQPADFNLLLERFEIPGEMRILLGGHEKKKRKGNSSGTAITGFLDGLSFPFLASGLILAAHFTSAKVLFNNRNLLNRFADMVGRYRHPKRILWLTDTYDDKNGVSHFLQTLHKEIQAKNLPIDILVCSNRVKSDDHLIVLKPLMDMQLPMYENQSLTVPDFLQIHQLFQQGEYDRVICSTEGVMGLAALYLKYAFSVQASFYIHTDWITFGKTALNLERPNLNRFRRILRAYYKQFDHLFVLNTEQQKWLTGREMMMDEKKVHLTAHWTDASMKPEKNKRSEIFGLSEKEPVMLFAGRVSHEKGIGDLVWLYRELKEQHSDLRLVVAGTGPALEEIIKDVPDVISTGWVNHDQLSTIYSSADILVLPSRFDTFSFVVLEAITCGLPVAAYNTKGPKDILSQGECGFLANTREEMLEQLSHYFADSGQQNRFRESATKRAAQYSANTIMNNLMKDLCMYE